MTTYYSDKLSADRLKQCYELAPRRVLQYLAAEIDHVRQRTSRASGVLELGCGYGRAIREIAPSVRSIIGIDTSLESLWAGRRYLADHRNASLCGMNAIRLGFFQGTFDLVFCIQNGISAFRVDPSALIESALEMTRPGGTVLVSSYAEELWDARLEWFRRQAAAGLIGEIDETATERGTIRCRDGFVARTISSEQFAELARGLGVRAEIEIVAESSLFCEIRV